MSKHYISPSEYKKMHPGLGIETIKAMVRAGTLEGYCETEEGRKYGRYHILVDDNDESRYTEEYVKKLEAENAGLKAIIASASKILTV